MNQSGSYAIPPFKLWLVGLVFIASSVILTIPRFSVPLLGRFLPPTVTTNDLLDGLLFTLLSCFIHKWNFPRGLSAGVFLCFCLKLIGHGAHMVANSAEILHGHDLRNDLGKHLFWNHEFFAHKCQYFGEFGLFAFYVYQYAPVQYLELDLGLEMPGFIFAGIHGVAAGVLAVGTNAVITLFPLYAVVLGIMVKRRRTLRSGILIYSYIFCLASFFFVGTWGALHGFAWPTFDEINNVYKK